MSDSERFQLNSENIVYADSIGWHKLVGYFFSDEDGMWNGGNCFSLINEKQSYAIVNFGYENLKLLLHMEIVKFPIPIYVLRKPSENSNGIAIIHDSRIPDRFYKSEFCSICCPNELLPLHQRAIWDLKIQRGHVKYSGMFTTIHKDVDGINFNGEDYSGIIPEEISTGSLNELHVNYKTRREKYLQKFIDAYNEMRNKVY